MRNRKEMPPNPHNLAKSDTWSTAENTAISTACELITDDYLQAIEPILAEASDIAQQRNTIMHGVLAVGTSGRIVQHIYRADRQKPHKQTVSIEKMDQLAARCSRLTLRLMEFTADPLGVVSADKIENFRRAFPMKD